jgi:hypothetical protein
MSTVPVLHSSVNELFARRSGTIEGQLV